jgi:hypothetical protein
LDFRTPGGTGTIFFDQGVGSWTPVGDDSFDHRLDVDEQLAELAKPFAIANGRDGTFFAIRLD